MTKKLRFVLLLVLLANCSKDNQNDPITEPDQNEDAAPEITISQFESLVEKKTNFMVSISGVDEQTNTTVLINENEVVSTNQKDFEIEINPFDYPNGMTTLRVKSVASNDVESVKNEEFEIKKLLFRSFGGLSSESVDSYLAINLQSTGELVAYKKIVTYDDPIFFHAEDNFIEEDIMVTEYILSDNSFAQWARTYGHVKPGTELIGIREVADELGLDLIWANTDSSLQLTIEGTSNSGLFSLLGRSYNFGNFAFPDFEIRYDEELTKDIFLYYLDQSNETILDNYRYAYIDNLTNQTIRYDEMSVVQADAVFTIDLPQTVERAGITLLGYTDEKEYRENLFRILFANGIETETADYSASYPVLAEYPITVKSISLKFLDGKEVFFNQKGIPDITVPSLTIQENDSIVQINGDHDFSVLDMVIRHPEPERNDIFRMSYKNQYRDSITMPFNRLEIPDEIVQFLNGKGLEVDHTSNTGQKELRISKYENKVFPNGVFHFLLGNEHGDSVDWKFPLEN